MNKEKPDPPEWWSKKPSPATKALWAPSVKEYMRANELEADELLFSKTLVKDMIPFVAKNDPQWKKFPVEELNINQYEAHMSLYQCIRNEKDRLIAIAEREQKEKEKKKDAAAK